MAAFRRTVERQSFRAAGLSLGLTGGAVSKLVAQLERDVGVRLLHRTTRSVRASAEGTAFYEAAVRILDDVDGATEALRARTASPAGRLKVSAPTSFALMWLASRLPAFIEAHPFLELDLVLNDRYVDIVQEGFDCAIRIATALPDSTLVARPLGTVERLLVAGSQYLQGAPPLEAPGDLAAHACLGYSQDGGQVEWPLHGTPDNKPVRVNPICRINNSVMLRELLLAGLGLTLIPAFVVDDLLREGRLVEVLARHRPRPLTVWGVVANPRHVAHRVALFLEFVRRGLGSHPP
jgi:DNA-binding transcriptional LysR family regulator